MFPEIPGSPMTWSLTPAGPTYLVIIDIVGTVPELAHAKDSHNGFRSSIQTLSDRSPLLRTVRYLPARKASFRLMTTLYRAGLVTRRDPP